MLKGDSQALHNTIEMVWLGKKMPNPRDRQILFFSSFSVAISIQTNISSLMCFEKTCAKSAFRNCFGELFSSFLCQTDKFLAPNKFNPLGPMTPTFLSQIAEKPAIWLQIAYKWRKICNPYAEKRKICNILCTFFSAQLQIFPHAGVPWINMRIILQLDLAARVNGLFLTWFVVTQFSEGTRFDISLCFREWRQASLYNHTERTRLSCRFWVTWSGVPDKGWEWSKNIF